MAEHRLLRMIGAVERGSYESVLQLWRRLPSSFQALVTIPPVSRADDA